MYKESKNKQGRQMLIKTNLIAANIGKMKLPSKQLKVDMGLVQKGNKSKNHCWYGAVAFIEFLFLGNFLKTHWSKKNCSRDY
jgi:hypothetical protein